MDSEQAFLLEVIVGKVEVQNKKRNEKNVGFEDSWMAVATPSNQTVNRDRGSPAPSASAVSEAVSNISVVSMVSAVTGMPSTQGVPTASNVINNNKVSPGAETAGPPLATSPMKLLVGFTDFPAMEIHEDQTPDSLKERREKAEEAAKIDYGKAQADILTEDRQKAKAAGLTLQEYKDSQRMKAASRISKKFKKGFAFANIEAAAEFEEQRARFFAEQERYDDYMEMREGLDLTNVQGFREHVIALTDPDRIPWYAGQTVFWLCSFLLLSWPLRLVLEYNTAYLHYKVTKLFGVNYEVESAIASTPSANISVNASTIDVDELEWGIKENTALVPSYSEALLMDTAAAAGTAQPSTNDRHHRRQSSDSGGGGGPALFFSTPLATTSPLDPYRSSEPPPYDEALALPGLSRLRRSLTDRGDICGRFLASRRRSVNTIRAPGRTRTLITMETSL